MGGCGGLLGRGAAAIVVATALASGAAAARPAAAPYPLRFELTALEWSSEYHWRATTRVVDSQCPGVTPVAGRTRNAGVLVSRRPVRLTIRRAGTRLTGLPLEIASLRTGKYRLVDCASRKSLGPRSCAKTVRLGRRGDLVFQPLRRPERIAVTWRLPIATFGGCVPTRSYGTGAWSLTKTVRTYQRQIYPRSELVVDRGGVVVLDLDPRELTFELRQNIFTRADTKGSFAWRGRLVLRRL
ncbi:MAG: hypothetical protein ABR521_06755 [Gaiellaceae bacterium]